MRGNFRKTILNSDKNLQSYIIGLAIGDGNLSSPDGKTQRLRITCDKKYPLLINKITDSLRELLPNNKVGIIDRDSGCLDISVYSNHLENLLGWKCKGGSKYKQKVSIPTWIKDRKEYAINCLRGVN